MSALAAMIQLETPHFNILSKMDLVKEKKQDDDGTLGLLSSNDSLSTGRWSLEVARCGHFNLDRGACQKHSPTICQTNRLHRRTG